jgi:hypothetical protein
MITFPWHINHDIVGKGVGGIHDSILEIRMYSDYMMSYYYSLFKCLKWESFQQVIILAQDALIEPKRTEVIKSYFIQTNEENNKKNLDFKIYFLLRFQDSSSPCVLSAKKEKNKQDNFNWIIFDFKIVSRTR